MQVFLQVAVLFPWRWTISFPSREGNTAGSSCAQKRKTQHKRNRNHREQSKGSLISYGLVSCVLSGLWPFLFSSVTPPDCPRLTSLLPLLLALAFVCVCQPNNPCSRSEILVTAQSGRAKVQVACRTRSRRGARCARVQWSGATPRARQGQPAPSHSSPGWGSEGSLLPSHRVLHIDTPPQTHLKAGTEIKPSVGSSQLLQNAPVISLAGTGQKSGCHTWGNQPHTQTSLNLPDRGCSHTHSAHGEWDEDKSMTGCPWCGLSSSGDSGTNQVIWSPSA